MYLINTDIRDFGERMPSAESHLQTLLLCENENSANVDRRALRDAGITHVKVMTSGIDAARLLAGMDRGEPPDLVICQRQLADMDGEQFCAIIRQHPRLLGLPVLLIMPNDSEADQLRTLGCGASALLGRPYSVLALRKQLATLVRAVPELRKIRQAAMQADTSAFDEALATYGLLLRTERSPEDYFKAGMRSLEEKRWPVAIAAFERALRDAQIRAEAQLGIAAAYKGKGDQARFRMWLSRACDTFVAARRWNRARSAYARLLQHDPGARNPFLAEAHRLIRAHEYNEAADVLVQSLTLLPKIKAGERYARVCMAADDPEEMLSALENSLAVEGDHDFMAGDIRASLEVMTRQREERKRQQAMERKWELAQSLARQAREKELARQESEKQARTPPAAAGVRNPAVETVPALAPAQDDELFVAPFGKSDVAGSNPSGAPKLNEFLSVIRLTWKLAKKSRKSASR